MEYTIESFEMLVYVVVGRNFCDNLQLRLFMKNHDDRSIHNTWCNRERALKFAQNFFDGKLNSNNNENSQNSKLIEPNVYIFFHTANIPYIFHVYIYHSFHYPSPIEFFYNLTYINIRTATPNLYNVRLTSKCNVVNVKLNKGIFMQKFTRNDYISTLQFYTSTPFRQ